MGQRSQRVSRGRAGRVDGGASWESLCEGGGGGQLVGKTEMGVRRGSGLVKKLVLFVVGGLF